MSFNRRTVSTRQFEILVEFLYLHNIYLEFGLIILKGSLFISYTVYLSFTVIKTKRKYPITKSKKAKCTKKEVDIMQLEQSSQFLIDIENARIAAEERSAAALSQIADAISTMAQSQTRIAVAIENLYNLQQRSKGGD